MSLEPGLTGKVKAVVTLDMTALSQGSGAVEGLATPVMVRLMEAAAITLVEVEGRLLIFSVSAEDAGGLIGKGTHQRVIVDKERFDDRIKARWTVGAQ